MQKRKICLLDLGGVTFQSTGTSNKTINWNIITQLNHKHGHGLNIGEDLFPTFMTEYNTLTHQNLSGQEFLTSVFDTLDFNKELIEMMREKRDIIIVSDNYRENIEYISQRYAFEEWSIKQIYSFDYQMVKAHPAFFPRLLSELQEEEKQELLFIDDSPHKIASAEKEGIKGILFQGNESVRELLK